MTKAGLWGMDEWIGAMDEKSQGGPYVRPGCLFFAIMLCFGRSLFTISSVYVEIIAKILALCTNIYYKNDFFV